MLVWLVPPKGPPIGMDAIHYCKTKIVYGVVTQDMKQDQQTWLLLCFSTCTNHQP